MKRRVRKRQHIILPEVKKDADDIAQAVAFFMKMQFLRKRGEVEELNKDAQYIASCACIHFIQWLWDVVDDKEFIEKFENGKWTE